MRLLDKFILYSSVFALFTEDFSYNFIIDWKLFYFIILINIVLLISKKVFFLNKTHIIILFALSIHGIIFYAINKNNIASLFAQLTGITLCSTYYYNFIKEYGKDRVVNIYLKAAIFFSILAIPMWVLKINFFDGRLNGILSEPAHYAAIMIPAVYILFKRKQYFKTSVIVLTIILAKSSIGFLGLILVLILPVLKLKHLLRISVLFLVLGITVNLYITSKWNEKFNENTNNQIVRKIKQTYESVVSVSNGAFEQDVNLTSYAIISNLFISSQNFSDHIFGTGLGSYGQQYEKYYPKMKPPEYLLITKQSKINKLDANSLFLRLISDLGIFAVFIVLFFFIRGYEVYQNKDNNLQQGAFIYLILKLIREGHYFPPEFYFFLLIFIKDFNESTTHSGRFLIK
jgi:hypothetical protein